MMRGAKGNSDLLGYFCEVERALMSGNSVAPIVCCSKFAEALLHLWSEQACESAGIERPRNEAWGSKNAGRGPGLGDMIGRIVGLARDGALRFPAAVQGELDRLNKARIPLVHATTSTITMAPHEVRECLRLLLTEVAYPNGLLTAEQVEVARRTAWEAERSVKPLSQTLDRAPQRHYISNTLQRKTLGALNLFVVDGERHQGHEPFAEFTYHELRDSYPYSIWPKVGSDGEVIRWPSGLSSPTARLARLFEDIGVAFEVAGDAPTDEPSLAGGEDGWQDYLAAVEQAVLARHGRDEGVFVRHLVLSLQSEDALVLAAYVRRLWRPIGRKIQRRQRPGCVLWFEVERAARGTMLTPAWWEWRREQAAAERFREALDCGSVLGGGTVADLDDATVAVALQEFGPVPIEDVVQELECHGMKKPHVFKEASRIMARSGGGRFDDIVREFEALAPKKGKRS